MGAVTHRCYEEGNGKREEEMEGNAEKEPTGRGKRH